MQAKIQYCFSSKMWQHSSPGGWFFIAFPKDISVEIRENLQWQEEGWGRMKATAAIGDWKWDTSIWFDKKMNTYLLPIKSEIRKKAKLQLDEIININIWI